MYNYTNLSFSTVLSEVEKSLEWVFGKVDHLHSTKVECQVTEPNLLHLISPATSKAEKDEMPNSYQQTYDKLGLSNLGYPRYSCDGFGAINHAKMAVGDDVVVYVDVFTISHTARTSGTGATYLKLTTPDGVVVSTMLLNNHSVNNLDNIIRALY